MLRFHSPLIEPDGRISRIRLSDKDSCVRTQEATQGWRSFRFGTQRFLQLPNRCCGMCQAHRQYPLWLSAASTLTLN